MDKKQYNREYYRRNRESALARANQYYQENKAVNLENKKQYNRKHYLRTREKQLARAKQYYQENKAARRAYHKKYYAEHWEQETNRMRRERLKKRAIRNRIALHYGCGNPDCRWEGSFDPSQLDFHHFNPKEKRGELSRMLGVRMEQFIAEINKCVVLCRCCHPLFHKGSFHLDESLKCDVDPATCLPRTPNTASANVGIRVTPSCHQPCDGRRRAGP